MAHFANPGTRLEHQFPTSEPACLQADWNNKHQKTFLLIKGFHWSPHSFINITFWCLNLFIQSPKNNDYTRVARNQIIITCHGPRPTISWQHRALSTVILSNIRYILHVLYSIRNRCPRQDTPYLVVHHHSLRNYNGVTPCPDNPIATRSLLIDLSSPALHNDAEMMQKWGTVYRCLQ